jgi:hypothetical protein
MSVFDQPASESAELTYRTIGLMFAGVAGAALFAVALSYLFFFVAEIGGHNRPLFGARCYTNPIARFSDRPLPYSPAKE